MKSWLLLLILLVVGSAWADKPSSAFIIALKGGVYKNLTPPGSVRPGTDVHLLERLPEDSKILVSAGSTVTLAFAKGGNRVIIKKAGVYMVGATDISPNPGEPAVTTQRPARGGTGYNVEAGDLSRFGAMPSRALGLATVHKREAPIRLDMDALPVGFEYPAEVALFWRSYKGEGQQGEWQDGKARLEHDKNGATMLVPLVEFKPGQAYQLALLKKKDEADFWVFYYSPEQLASLASLSDLVKPGASPEDQLVFVHMLCDYMLYDEAIERVHAMGPEYRTVEDDIRSARKASWTGYGK